MLLFDFDGVLADSEPFYRLSWNMALEPWGHTIPEEDYWKYWTSLGQGLDGEMERNSLTGIDRQEAAARQKSFYRDMCTGGRIPLFDGVPRLLERLMTRTEPGSRHFCIASNTEAGLVRTVLENGGAPVPFIIGGEGLRKKPHPDIFLRAASENGVDPSACLVFEDAEKGITAGLAAGMAVVFVENSLNGNIRTEGICRIPGISVLGEVLDQLMGECQWR